MRDRHLAVRAARLELKEGEFRAAVMDRPASTRVRDRGFGKYAHRSRRRTVRNANLITYFAMRRGGVDRHRANIRGRRAIDFIVMNPDSRISRAHQTP